MMELAVGSPRIRASENQVILVSFEFVVPSGGHSNTSLIINEINSMYLLYETSRRTLIGALLSTWSGTLGLGDTKVPSTQGPTSASLLPASLSAPLPYFTPPPHSPPQKKDKGGERKTGTNQQVYYVKIYIICILEEYKYVW